RLRGSTTQLTQKSIVVSPISLIHSFNSAWRLTMYLRIVLDERRAAVIGIQFLTTQLGLPWVATTAAADFACNGSCLFRMSLSCNESAIVASKFCLSTTSIPLELTIT